MLALLRLASTTPSYAPTDYFYLLPADLSMTTGGNYTFTQSDWSTHTGGVATFVTADNFNLNINGVLQADGIYTVGSALVINYTATASTVLQAGTPFTLQAGTITPTLVAVP